MVKAYATVITEDEGCFLVELPDMRINTEGKSLEDAIFMGRDAMEEMGLCYMDAGETIPEASYTMEEALEYSSFADVGKQIVTLIDVDFEKAKLKSDSRAVRRNVTLPNWLNIRAEESGINVSKVLQDALIQILGVRK